MRITFQKRVEELGGCFGGAGVWLDERVSVIDSPPPTPPSPPDTSSSDESEEVNLEELSCIPDLSLQGVPLGDGVVFLGRSRGDGG